MSNDKTPFPTDCNTRIQLSFWHLPKSTPFPDRPFAFSMRDVNDESIDAMSVWFGREDIQGYIDAMQKALNGEVILNDGR